MKGKWYVSSNTINGERMYIATRKKDVNGIVHGGNVEHCGGYTTKEKAQATADKMNGE